MLPWKYLQVILNTARNKRLDWVNNIFIKASQNYIAAMSIYEQTWRKTSGRMHIKLWPEVTSGEDYLNLISSRMFPLSLVGKKWYNMKFRERRILSLIFFIWLSLCRHRIKRRVLYISWILTLIISVIN